MRLTRDASRERTRDRLLEAARDCVMQRGYDGASIGDIAEAAGFTKGAFFSNFESKEALLLELLRRHKAEQIETLRAILEDSGNSPTASPAFDCYIDRLGAGCGYTLAGTLWIMLDIELELQASRNPAFAVSYNEVEQTFRSAMGALIARLFERKGRALPAEPGHIAGLLLALARGLVLASAADPAHPGFSAQIKLTLGSLLAAAPAVPLVEDASSRS